MKKNLILALMASTFLACNAPKETETKAVEKTTVVSDEQQYACSMDPDVIGKKGEKCTKCGMELTEPVVAKK
jgi:Heavy metal binding domain